MATYITKHFTLEQFTCKCGCGFNKINLILVEMLQKARLSTPNTAYIITSGCRCIKHNDKVGGVGSSAHTTGKAADIKYTSNKELYIILSALINAGFKRIGINFKQQFIHVDIDYNKPYPCIFSY